MPVLLNKLINKPENRQIRKIINVAGESIKVFNPTREDVERIVDVQERWINSDNSEVTISGEDMVRILFPMLTDIEGFENLSDSEVAEISNNPSMLYMQLQFEIEGIILDVYNTLLAAHKRHIKYLDLEVGLQTDAVNALNEMFANAPAKEQEKIKDQLAEIEEFKSDQLKLVIDNTLDTVESSEEESETNTKLSSNKYEDKLESYKTNFKDTKVIKE
ncbi:TPA: hypothetical protein ACGO1T_000547 [Streptococcus suis]